MAQGLFGAGTRVGPRLGPTLGGFITDRLEGAAGASSTRRTFALRVSIGSLQ